jgi:hypothetical protein
MADGWELFANRVWPNQDGEIEGIECGKQVKKWRFQREENNKQG